MSTQTMKTVKKKPTEASFSLIETVIALGLIATFLLEMAGVQGNAIYFSDYGMKATKATWLARSVLSRVEYEARNRPLKELKVAGSEQNREFENFKEEDFQYNLSIEEWKLPIFNLLSAGGGGGDDEGGSSEEGEQQEDMFTTAAKMIFEDEPMFKIAKVEVSWPEGAFRNSVESSLLIANIKKINEAFVKFNLKEKVPKQDQQKGKTPPKVPPVGTPPPGSLPTETTPIDDGP